MVSTLAGKMHKTLHHAETDEIMVPSCPCTVFLLFTVRLLDATLYT